VTRKSQIQCMNNGRPPISRCWDTCCSTCQETLSSKFQSARQRQKFGHSSKQHFRPSRSCMLSTPGFLKATFSSISEYIGKMCAFADDMASTGKPLDDEDLVSYILARLDEDYNSVITPLVARPDTESVA
jgi:hypothetical protein